MTFRANVDRHHRVLAPVLCLGLTIMLSACASRGPGHGPPPEGGLGPRGGGEMLTGKVAKPIGLLFTSMDVNDDYLITRAELIQGSLTEWQKLDPDQNGEVMPIGLNTWSEKALGGTDVLPNRLSFDTDLNGGVTQLEFLSRIELEFEQLDKDGNDILTRTELLYALPSMKQREGQPSGAPGGRGAPPPGGGPGPGR